MIKRYPIYRVVLWKWNDKREDYDLIVITESSNQTTPIKAFKNLKLNQYIPQAELYRDNGDNIVTLGVKASTVEYPDGEYIELFVDIESGEKNDRHGEMKE